MSNASLIDYEPYSPQNVPLFEALYGPDLISLGSTPCIEQMFLDLPIKNMRALDIGFGLGGVAFYLAKQYQAQICGIEIHPWMVEHAKNHTPEHLEALLNFYYYEENGRIPFEENTFNVVYSKGVFNHIKNKVSLLNDIHRVLKPSGMFVILDWIFPKDGVENHGVLATETQASYTHLLNEAHFQDVIFNDVTPLFLGYVRDFLNNLQQKKAFIEKTYSEDLFFMIERHHQELLDAILHKRKFATRIVAHKK